MVRAPPRPTQSKYKRAGGTGQGTTPRGLRKASACKRADGITSTCAEPLLYMCDIVRYHFAKAWLAYARMRTTYVSPGSRPSRHPPSIKPPGLLPAHGMLLAAPARGASSACSRAALGCSRSPLLPHVPGSRRLPLPAAPGGSRLLPIASGWCPVVFAASARPIPEAEHVHNFTPAWGASLQMRCYGVEALGAICAI